MALTRRQFLSCTVTGCSAISLKGAVPALFAQAAASTAARGQNDRVLVVVELAGGNDGLNTIVPYEDDLYYTNRATLAVPKNEVLRLSTRLGLHPKMEALHALYKEGQVAIVQGVGYPNPDRSHFRSAEIWHTASVNSRPPTTGWLGRYVDTVGRSDDPETFAGVALTASLPQAFLADRVVVPVTAQIDALVSADADPARASFIKGRSQGATGDQALTSFVKAQERAVFRTAERLKEATARYKSSVVYPETDLGAQLKRAAQIINANLGARVLFAQQAGYDTHSYQASGHGALLEELSNALAAFQKDLRALKADQRVVTMVFSEFGRRVSENASAGTDHGAASCMVLVGARVKGGLAGKYPNLETLDEGDLSFTTDFRSVYATVLGSWMAADAPALLGGAFPNLDILNARV